MTDPQLPGDTNGPGDIPPGDIPMGNIPLGNIPLGDDGSPVFAAPWEASAFAITVRLSAQGHFTWDEWTATLSEEIRMRHSGRATPTWAIPITSTGSGPWSASAERAGSCRRRRRPTARTRGKGRISTPRTENRSNSRHITLAFPRVEPFMRP